MNIWYHFIFLELGRLLTGVRIKILATNLDSVRTSFENGGVNQPIITRQARPIIILDSIHI